jgi:hypothetical protein
MAGVLDAIGAAVGKAIGNNTPGYSGAAKALGNANDAATSAAVKSYQDKYGPTLGQQYYAQDQAKAAAAKPAATAPGQGHMGSWADQMHPTNK